MQSTVASFTESQELFDTLVARSMDGIILARDGKILYMNKTVLDLMGEKYAGDLYKNLLPELKKAKKQSAGLKRKSAGPSHISHHLMQGEKKRGGKIDLEITTAMIHYQGKPAFLVCIRNIPAGKRLKGSREASQTLYEALLNNSRDGIVISRKTSICYANRAFKKILGIDENTDLLGEDVLNQIAPEYRKLVKSRAVARQRGEEVPSEYEIKAIREDGSLADLDLSATMTYYNGEPASLVIIRDITEKKRMEEAIRKSEAELQAIYNSVGMSFSILKLNKDCRVIKMNLRGKEEFGDLAGKICYEVLKKTSRPCEDCLALKVLKDGTPYVGEVQYYTHDGTSKFYNFSALPMLEEGQSMSSILLILQDVTEKKLYERQLREREKMSALGVMASGVAHDFNNLLGSLLTRTELLLEFGRDVNKIKEGLKIIQKTVLDGAQTVKRVQQFSRKRVKQEFTEIDLNQVIRDVLELTEPFWKNRAEEKGIVYRFQTRFGRVSPILGHAGELQDVVMNLVNNAMEAMAEGGTLTIRTGMKGSVTQAEFVDTGCGIKQEILDRIFDPFFTTKSANASGLGLSISYNIVKNHDGSISAQNNPTGGAILTIAFPARKQRGKKKARTKKDPLAEKEKILNILVVEDKAEICTSLQEFLELHGHAVDVALTGKKGLEAFSEKTYDLVITDIGMPEKSGWEVSREVKRKNPDTKVALITGWGIEEKDPRVRKSRADILIHKPFKLNQIQKIISEIS